MQCPKKVKSDVDGVCPHQIAQNEQKKIEMLKEKMEEVGSLDTGSNLCTAMTKDASVDMQTTEHPKNEDKCGPEKTDRT